MMKKPDVTVAGAGLAGSLLTLYLGQRGYQVELYERRPDLRKGTTERGRSINLALSTRGLHALEEVGLAATILQQHALPMKGRLMHGDSGTTTFQQYGRHADEVNYSVSRTGLNIVLLNAAEQLPNVRIIFDHRCQGFDEEARTVEFSQPGSNSRVAVPFQRLIGADGAFSAVRQQLQRRDRVDFRQEYLDWGYKELTIPASPQGSFALRPDVLHIWPRQAYMLIALPNLDGSFTCTLFLPFEGPHSFGDLRSDQEIIRFFQHSFPDALPSMPTLADDYRYNPVNSLVTIQCAPWRIEDKVLLIGDACHAVVPFYGQGMNASFEDCSVLNQCLADHAPSWETVFERFEALRRPNTDALAELSRENFVEMRSKVASPFFLARKRAEHHLNRAFPRHFIPLYNMVTHTLIPYAEALQRARRQDRWINRLGWILLLGVVAGLWKAVIKR